eukprot:CAMPEP_0173187132 /NCGR_PEP_ID=MMETSP1141-20130122/10523_1 /TAXON_ID=483371 /ORGANISM="non described non described, Strain CCMP2298" /LENGTH=51 /DNA_ID=CAMNT_0014110903 /DNA_START=333 /DNA_END=488 /DNA_ORIENTATION=-
MADPELASTAAQASVRAPQPMHKCVDPMGMEDPELAATGEPLVARLVLPAV